MICDYSILCIWNFGLKVGCCCSLFRHWTYFVTFIRDMFLAWEEVTNLTSHCACFLLESVRECCYESYRRDGCRNRHNVVMLMFYSRVGNSGLNKDNLDISMWNSLNLCTWRNYCMRALCKDLLSPIAQELHKRESSNIYAITMTQALKQWDFMKELPWRNLVNFP